MAARVLVGNLANLFARGTLAMTPAADASYPVTNIADGIGSRPARFGAATSGTVSVDGTLVVNGTMESASSASGPLAGWTDGSSGGRILQSTGAIFAGSYSMSLESSSSGAIGYEDISVRAGEYLTLEAQLNANGSTSLVVRLFNRQTQHYCTSSGGWQAGVASVLVTTSCSDFVFKQLNGIQVEGIATILAPTCTLRLTVQHGSTGKTAYADMVALYPRVNIAAVHGHSIEPGITVNLLSSTSSGFGAPTTQSTMSVAHPTFYSFLSSSGVDAQWWQLRFTGTPTAAIYLGEAVIGYATGLNQEPDNEVRNAWKYAWRDLTISQATPLGERYVVNLQAQPTQGLSIPWSHFTATDQAEFHNEMRLRSRGGAYLALVIPDDSEASVILGRTMDRWDLDRRFPSPPETHQDVVIEPLPTPIFGL